MGRTAAFSRAGPPQAQTPKEHMTYLGAGPTKKSEGEQAVGGDHKIYPHSFPGWTGMEGPL